MDEINFSIDSIQNNIYEKKGAKEILLKKCLG